MFSASLKLELALEEIAHSFHLHLDERHTILDSLRYDDGRVNRAEVVVGNDGLSISFHVASCHTCLQVDGGCRDGIVNIYRGIGWHVALEVLSLDEADGEFAHDMLEGKIHR